MSQKGCESWEGLMANRQIRQNIVLCQGTLEGYPSEGKFCARCFLTGICQWNHFDALAHEDDL